jgi:hypothetical protein
MLRLDGLTFLLGTAMGRLSYLLPPMAQKRARLPRLRPTILAEN